MELVDQHTKKIMEGCKERARDAGLRFEKESLEYIVTNRDLLELTPKIMIPTLYDYWVHDVEVLKEKRKYELYPYNPYETVINTRPAISFYNDNNPDWLNVMIFYHVIAHIDFFQNNLFFQNTWNYDFTAQALSDKRCIAALRAEKGRYVDYVIEFGRGMDNLVGYYNDLARTGQTDRNQGEQKIDYYFDVFLQDEKKAKISEYVNEIDRFNQCQKQFGELGENTFFADTHKKYPEFETFFNRYAKNTATGKNDIFEYIMQHSNVFKKEQNAWMKTILEIIRKTSLFFQPQIRTKILNEGWASYWHETLFLKDDRISGHEVDFAKINAGVTSMPRVGLNPYALGMRLFYAIEECADKGKRSYEYERLLNIKDRKDFDKKAGNGKTAIFKVREAFSDLMFVNTFIDQDFINKHNLFVAGKRRNASKMVWEYYVKSRKAEDYKKMVVDSLYHPPKINIHTEKNSNGCLYLSHAFEGKPLKRDFIGNTLLGMEYLWGNPVCLETTELIAEEPRESLNPVFSYFIRPTEDKPEVKKEWRRVVYTMENKRLSKKVL